MYDNDFSSASGQPAVGAEQLRAANAMLDKYRQAKANFDDRIIAEEQWYEMRMDEKKRRATRIKEIAESAESYDGAVADAVRRARLAEEARVGRASVSQWMFSAIAGKHADAMDNVPTAAVLPREERDEGDAQVLSSILPVILQRANWDRVYSRGEWCKLKHGACAYGVWWNQTAENGIGDIAITNINMLNLYWDMAVDNIQDSPNVFILALEDRKKIKQMYPDSGLDDGDFDDSRDIKQFLHEDSVDDTDKVVVVDWYYKVYKPDGRTVLHYAKYTGETLLYASENSAQFAESGWYEHGRYPVEIDTLFPIEGTASGFGLIAITQAPQEYIDLLDRNIIGYAERASHYKVMCKTAADMNIAQFLDPSQEVVEVSGDVDDSRFRQVQMNPIDSMYLTLRANKIDELKETSSNRDVSQGSSTGGVTAASAIAALQEAGNKTSRDSLAGAYRVFELLMQQVVELIRQFYTEERYFRIIGDSGIGRKYVTYSNANIRDVQTGTDSAGQPLWRRAIFDIDVRAAKKNPYNQISQNETMKELFKIGALNPENASQAIAMLDGMDFDGIEQVKERVEENATIQAQLNAAVQWIAQVTGTESAQILSTLQGQAQPVSRPLEIHLPQSNGAGMEGALAQAQAGGVKARATDFAQTIRKRGEQR